MSTQRFARILWGWCVVYTAVAPPPSRARRRDEMRSHLWEAAAAGIPAGALAWSVARGAGSDVSWACGARLRRVVPVVTSPAPYVVMAAVSTLCGAFSSAVDPHHQQWTHHVEFIALLIAVWCLVVAGCLAFRGRRH